ncbi:SDR family NAD(P)-dependent oxidoreductase [Dactylosporangium sp. CA-233914]|uniref:SDR family NAD(P)-dependent oxidoreductase n=1 Tax=Dactylosporangium sp. CA-233914 TaxID=3239934 RepID=UPI003D93809F
MNPVGPAIAVIGISCRLPAAADPAAFWRLLHDGTSAITRVPADRWDGRAAFDQGGFLPRVDEFDAGFFGISPREARAMDPQQRLMLELAWEAVEDARIVPDTLRGGRTGVFVAAIWDDYAKLLARRAAQDIGRYDVTGTHRSIIANRVSYALGLHGPSLAVDAGQSSGLVAVHLACASLRSGESTTAIVGGVNLMIVPESTIGSERFGALSPTGRCHTFDARADGYVRGEGGAAVMLKPLADAVRDGDPVHCVIRGSAVNNDGATDGLTVPSADAQERVLRDAYRDAGVDPATVQYVELHGTGTRVGDPIEAAALAAALRTDRRAEPLRVGSVKTNIGHLEAAAGLAGLTKVALSIRNRMLPPSLNFTTPNPDIPVDELGLRVQTRLEPWPDTDGPLVAGVSSFGMGGTNCHVVVTEPPARPAGAATGAGAAPTAWLLSARDDEALRRQAGKLLDPTADDPDPAAVALSLATTRTAFDRRAVVIAADGSPAALRSGLAALARGGTAANVVRGAAAPGRLGFLFGGQGGQRARMGRQLRAAYPAFAEPFDAVVAEFDRLLPRPLSDVLSAPETSPDAALLDRTGFTQPALLAVEIALFRLYESVGVTPDVLLGHSIGELAAAHVAGVLSLPDVCTLVAARASLMQSLPAGGAMAAIEAAEDEVRALLPGTGRLDVAAVNAPSSTVVAGDEDAVTAFAELWSRQGRRVKRLRVSHAFHCAHMDPILDDFRAVAAGLHYAPPAIPIISNVTGAFASAADITTPDYWVRHARAAVRFADGVRTMHHAGVGTVIELSPDGALTAMARDQLPGCFPAMRAQTPEVYSWLLATASAHTRGVPVDWPAVLAVPDGTRPRQLPTYAFNRRRYWIDDPDPVPAAVEQTVDISDISDIVAEEIAGVLGHADTTAVVPDRTFKELGFDSLASVELRDRIRQRTGRPVPPGLVYDYPTPAALAAFLRAGATGGTTAPVPDRNADEPIAIVAMAGRYPGGARSSADLWQLVVDEVDAITPFPDDRGWRVDPAAGYVRPGGFLHDAGDFDAGFFGIGPREATAMDPQQRLVLETSWEALEVAGIDPSALRGTPTGVFVGATSLDYGPRLHEATGGYEGYVLTGSTTSVTSGRIAYTLGLSGPAITVDTACSSSLVAVHLAAQSLRNGECRMALAGGVTVMATAGMFIEFAHQGGLSADGRCKSFADRADGTGWSEGVGMLVLERLSDARRNGRRVLAVIAGSAVNQDGASNGLTAPNGPAQARVIRQALANARLTPADVDAVEAHGTGTTLGDPIEAQALLDTYGQDRAGDEPLWLGSIKSNIGHTQAAAGVAGVIKMVHALNAGILPKTLHADTPTSHVDWSGGRMALLTEPIAWPDHGRPRRAAVSSFGISGTNAHLILEQAPAAADAPATAESGLPLLLSAKTEAALAASAGQLVEHLHEDLAAVAYTLATGRALMSHRAVVLPGHDAAAALRALADGGVHPGLVRGMAGQGGLAFLFTGQGSQYSGMGAGLYERWPVFASTLDDVCAVFDPLLEHPLREVMLGAHTDLLGQTRYTQPALFAYQVALYRLLQDFGLTPDYLTGHSIGEVTAAHIAGVFGLADAARLVAARGALMQQLPPGAMLAVTADTIDAYLEGVEVAAHNSPTAHVLAGEPDAIAALAERLAADGVRARRLHVDRAFHTSHTDAILDQFREVAVGIDYQPPSIPVVATLTGELTDPDYWVRHIRHTVEYAAATERLHTLGVTRFLEVGPDAVLATLTADALTIPTQHRDRDQATAFITALATAHVHGLPVRWPLPDPAPTPVVLPTYPFQRQRYWLDATTRLSEPTDLGLTNADHPVLAAVVDLPDSDTVLFTGTLSLDAQPWIADHTVQDTVLLPGTAFVELALHAGHHVGHLHLHELTLQTPLTLHGDEIRSLHVEAGPPDSDGHRPITIRSRIGEQDWTRHATGTLATTPGTEPVDSGITWPPDGAPVRVEDLYTGLDRGPVFQGVTAAWRTGDRVYAEVALPEEADTADWGIHPALLDAALHAAALLTGGQELRLPFTWSGVTLHATGARHLRVRLERTGHGAVTFTATDPAGNLVATARTVTTRVLPADELAALSGADVRGSLFSIGWVTVDPVPEPAEPTEVLRVRGGGDVVAGTHRLVEETLRAVQAWLADERHAASRLVVLTRRAVAVVPGEDVTDLAGAAVWGLLRSAQSEHPGRFMLLDADTDDVATAVGSDEPQLAMRDGRLLAPRLARTTTAQVLPLDLDADGTVLITGGTGTLGALLAEHLTTTGRAKHLLLVSRRGPDAPGTDDLVARLRQLGAAVTVVACDTADATAVNDLIAGIPADRPLTAVFHTAGVLADATLEGLTADQVHTVLRPKVDAAWNLHRATAHLDLAAFVLYSSVTGVLGSPGQGNYAAANTFLDALAQHRHAHGLPATALAWGYWAHTSGMTATLNQTDWARIARSGLVPLPPGHALQLLDAVLRTAHPTTVVTAVNRAALRARAGEPALPAPLRGLAGPPRRRAATGQNTTTTAAVDRLAHLSRDERVQLLFDVVLTETAVVLGRTATSEIDHHLAFKELGIGSLGSVELRNRLNARLGLRLPTTVIYDYPAPDALVSRIDAEVSGRDPARRTTAPATAGTGEPIAIVGMSCRYPGAGSPEALWRLVESGTDAITTMPTDRGWNLSALHDPDSRRPGTSYTRYGGFLHDAAEFDADFFGISPREALAMDPQQRLLLEAGWRALEDAGIDPTTLKTSPTGVFTGVAGQEYTHRVSHEPHEVAGHLITGGALSVASGRVAYVLGLEGPAITVDTACSSSLVATHLAIQSLRTGECSLALAGGATVMSTPTIFIEFSTQGGLSADGRCKPFADQADGTGWSEGVGMLVLERLSDAERNGHRVLAVIAGSAVNQDGASNGLTAPNGPSQERVIRQALANARLTPADVDAVEAHGTGTTLGDPIEAQALLSTYGQDRTNGQPLWLGSIKSNIGHAQAAAGVAGVIKMVQALNSGVLPQTLHVDAPSSHVDWDSGQVSLLTEPVAWPDHGRPRRAAVSSFGISGTNAHLILEQAPRTTPAASDTTDLPLLLSAKTEAALAASAGQLTGHLHENLAAVAHTLATGRALMPHRAVILPGHDPDQALRALATGSTHPGLVRGIASAGHKTVFVFPGQGGQWAGMGRALAATHPVFAQHLDACAEAFRPWVDWDLHELLHREDTDWLTEVDLVQPALFAVMTGLAALWRHHGITPDAVIGHSQGEIAAAHTAGALTLHDAAHIITRRSQTLRTLIGHGDMAAIELPPNQLHHHPDVHIAAYNGPTSTVIAGDPHAVAQVVEHCRDNGIRARVLPVHYASHTPHIDTIKDQVLTDLAGITPQPATVAIYSTLTGDRIDPLELTAGYWYDNLRQPVQFQQAAEALLRDGHHTYIETSPHPTLIPSLEQVFDTASSIPVAIATQHRDQHTTFTTALAAAHVHGLPVQWPLLDPAPQPVSLPTYPFQRRHYWLNDAHTVSEPADLGQTSGEHPLLAAAIDSPDSGIALFTGRLSLDTQPWIADHAVQGTVLLPGTAFVELALHAGHHTGHPHLHELTLEAPLVLSGGEWCSVHVEVGAAGDDGLRPVVVRSRAGERDWTRHATGSLAVAPAAVPPGEWLPTGASPVAVDGLYGELAASGLDYGPAFRGVTGAWRAGGRIHAEVALPEELGTAGWGIHPALLDAAFHAAALLPGAGDEPGVRLPFTWSGITLHATGARQLRVVVEYTGPDTIRVSGTDPSGGPVISVEGLTTRALPPGHLERLAGSAGHDSLFQLHWTTVPAPVSTSSPSPMEVLRVRGGGEVVSGTHRLVEETLRKVQDWLSDDRHADSRLVIHTRGAVAVAPGEDVTDLAATAVWGLIRSAQSEHPGRFVLVDADTDDVAAAVGSGEPQLAVRDGQLLAPRLARTTTGQTPPLDLDADGTVLITGGTGTLGALLAEHLATSGRAKHLLLVSRRGSDAPGADDLATRLRQLGATATVAACDTADPDAVTALIAGIPADRPLTAVFHTAGALDDATLEGLTPQRLHTVLRPKVDAAWHLHQATAHLDLAAFVLYSSAAGVLGNPGQGNYAAANTFLDAIAQHRHAHGLPATAVAWGYWESASGMTAHLADADRARLVRSGLVPLSTERALPLLDAALASGSPALIATAFDRSVLRARTGDPAFPAVLRDLVPTATRRTASTAGAAERHPGRFTAAELRRLVATHAAGVLGHQDVSGIDPGRALRELGFDSLTAVELRNRLNAATGLRLSATVVFDHPSVNALSDHLAQQLVPAAAGPRRAAPVVAAMDEPIAIVGMACRYPGADSPDELWQLVRSGTDAITGMPTDRGWNLAALYDPDPDHPGTSYTRHGGFLHAAAEFDADFFGISPREAAATDPQQRLLLETAWQALEAAGIDPTSLKASATGVFTGVMYDDYATRLHRVPAGYEGYLTNGSAGSVASGRLAYTLGLEGPAISVDTACSSSLVATHLAMQSLRNGECTLALAGGVTVLATPGVFVEFSRQRGLSADGRCKSFADQADGTGWSEGVGMLVLERLSDAERNGHRILAVIAGSAVNQDGASNGLTAPNGPSQERVIRQALASARLTPADVDAVEAHGTGTTLGDPIEAQALLATYGQERPDGQPLWLGSIKSNIGHSQAAAGIAGVIKMVQAMNAGVLPQTLHVDSPSSHVDWESGQVSLLTEPVEWPDHGRPRRAAVSSFGISGTNAHLILEQAPSVADAPVTIEIGLPLLLSARTEAALAASAGQLVEHVHENLAGVAYTLVTGRALMSHRAVILPGHDAAAALRALADGGVHPGVVRGVAGQGGLAFLFTGQGSQHPGMGVGLYEQWPGFASALDEVCAAFDPLLAHPLREVMFGDHTDLLSQTRYTQPALFAFQVSLYRLLRDFGLSPDYLAGHSIGEVTAAHVAGVFGLSDAARLVVARGALLQQLPAGAMLAVTIDRDALSAYLRDGVEVAAHNSPTAHVLAGDPDTIAALAEELDRDGVRARRLHVDRAFHTSHTDAILDQFREVAAGIDYQPPSIPVVSTLTGDLTDPEYWVRHIRHTVEYAAATERLHELGVTRFLEVGPDAVLATLTADTLDDVVTIPTQRRDQDQVAAFTAALAAAHVHGLPVRWPLPDPAPAPVVLPTYPFQRQRYWLDAGTILSEPADLGQAPGDHPLLAAAIDLPDTDTILFTGRISLDTQPWITDHTIHGTALLPGTAFVELALHTGHHVGHPHLHELTLQTPLSLTGDESRSLHVEVGPPDDGHRSITIRSRGGEQDWVRHAIGTLAATLGTEPAGSGMTWPPEAVPIELPDFYTDLAASGLQYGPVFQGVTGAWRADGSVYAEITLPEQVDVTGWGVHPALLDAALHPAALLAGADGGVRLPFAWSGIALHAAGARHLRVLVESTGSDTVRVTAADQTGSLVATIDALTVRALPAGHLNAPARDMLFHTTWTTIPTPTFAPGPILGRAELASAGDAPEAVVLTVRGGGDVVADTHRLVGETLRAVQAWLADERCTGSRLVVLTRGAVAAVPGEDVTDLAGAAVWGLLRSAQSEHPGRFVLVDADTEDHVAAASSSGEPQLAVRDGRLLVPRLARTITDQAPPLDLDAGGTVLISGSTGALGGLLAEHLAATGRTKHLLLTSRRGPDAPGADDLVNRLRQLGAAATVVACDTTDPDAVNELIAGIPAGRPLTAVFHTAGVLADATLQGLTSEQLHTVLRPKVDAAWNLHHATKHLDLAAFVLYSSVSGTLGSPGQGNYAAANMFLDALAQHRRAHGLPATALAWGYWGHTSGMTAHLNDADRARIARSGLVPLATDHALRLLETAIVAAEPAVVAATLDTGALRAGVHDPAFPVLLRGLVPAGSHRPGRGGRIDLAGLDEAGRYRVLAKLVQDTVAAVLGHQDAAGIDVQRVFKDLGFDSLTAVELRNRLNTATGLRLSATAVFDHPSVHALSVHLAQQLVPAIAEPRKAAPVAAAMDEPIAIVGMACRYPGADSPEELWQLVQSGTDAITGMPTDRGWNLAALYNPDPDHPGTSYTRHGGFLHAAAEFDADFFGISPREAAATDPQQRLLLETTWQALETAGIDPTSLKTSATGVFTGVMYDDYATRLHHIPAGYEGYLGNGSAGSVASGRLAYTLGLEGPAITIDTACSSSLVATHLAMQSLRNGECTLALAGGVTVLATPGIFVEFSRQRGLSADGRCKSFADQADGTGWSEGVGMLVLERLSDAERNGHRVLAVIAGSAVNQDGASNGLTAPNGPSQERVIRQALANARLTPADVDAVEAHGTGTTLGDPIEAQALLATYGQERADGQPLWLGSIKSNIGHSQAAAGVAGIIKMVQAMNAGLLPKTLHVDTPSSHVDWDSGHVALLTEPTAWPDHGRPRRAAVSSFGISGTNAHLILEQAPPPAEQTQPTTTDLPLLLSAKTETALAASAGQLAEHLHENLAAVAHTLATGRALMPHRAVILPGHDPATALRALAGGDPHPSVVRGTAGHGTTAFLFTGQGAQHPGMGAGLYDHYPVVATTLDDVCAAFDPLLEHPLREVMFGAHTDLLGQTRYTQPALFAYQVALYRLLQDFGLTPDHLTGHSIGEVTAAYIAGVFGLADAVRLVAARGALMQQLPPGAMLSVTADIDTLDRYLKGVEVAAHNSPTAHVLAGDPDVIAALAEQLDRDGVRARRLHVDRAFHTSHTDAILDQFREVAAGIDYQPPTIPVASTLPGELTDPDYWVRHIRHAVEYTAATERLHQLGVTRYVEVGPDAVLTTLTADTVGDVVTIPTQRRDQDQTAAFITALATAHVHGLPVRWPLPDPAPAPVVLPTYPFQRQRYWLDAAATLSEPADLGLASANHPLLAAAIDLPDNGSVLFTGTLSLGTQPWIADHAVQDTVLLPGAAFVELALHAGQHTGHPHLHLLTIETPLPLTGKESRALHVEVGPPDDGHRSITIRSRISDQDWTRHATGTLATTPGTEPADDGMTWPPDGTPVELYADLAATGMQYGPVFQGVTAAWRVDDRAFAEVVIPEEVDVSGWGIHPALLDAALHSAVLLIGGQGVRLPFAWSGISLFATGARQLRVVVERTGSDTVRVTATDPAGGRVVAIDALTVRALPGGRPDVVGRGSLFQTGWTTVAAPTPGPSVETVVLPVRGSGDVVTGTHDVVAETLRKVQAWLADTDSRLVVLTRGAVAAVPGDDVTDLAGAAVWGLLRSAQSEHPGRFMLLDTDDSDDIAAAVASGEPQAALRNGTMWVPRLRPLHTVHRLQLPTEHWRVDVGTPGTVEGLTVVDNPRPAALEPGQVRVAIRATGVNFRDVLMTLGMYPGAAVIGAEAAGVVTEVGADVTSVAVGDRVMGLFFGALADHAVTDARLLTQIPAGWTYPQAATVPVVFLTAYYALVDLAQLQSGQRILIHAGAGGVGMAAIQLATHFGADIYATASPGKWPTLHRLGIQPTHIASSRTLDYRDQFHDVDVVLNALTGEHIAASLNLLSPGGHFLEMGKTDLRDPADHPGVRYRPFDLFDAGPDRIQQMLTDLLDLFDRNVLQPLPYTAWPVQDTPTAYRHLAQGHNIGKIVLTHPTPINPDGTVLITGGTGTLGALLAEHLAESGRTRHLLLTSRRGADAPGADDLIGRLQQHGATATIVACDTADPAAVDNLIKSIPADRPLTAVFHTAGVLHDATLESLTPDHIHTVLRPKVDAAWNLHHATQHLDLAAFVLYSSVAGTLGSPGQANYAAANTFLDALAQHRRARGLPATAVAWGYWEHTSGMTAHLSDADRLRITRTGLTPMPTGHALQLLDTALHTAHPALTAATLNTNTLHSDDPATPAILRDLAPAVTRRVAATNTANATATLTGQLARLGAEEQTRLLHQFVAAHTAAVLGHASAAHVPMDLGFMDMGFDSLTAVELRNRLHTATGLRMPPTLVFDHPTPIVLAEFLKGQLAPVRVDPVDAALADMDRLIGAAELDGVRRRDVAARLRSLLDRIAGDGVETEAAELLEVSDDELFDIIDNAL